MKDVFIANAMSLIGFGPSLSRVVLKMSELRYGNDPCHGLTFLMVPGEVGRPAIAPARYICAVCARKRLLYQTNFRGAR